MYALLQVQSEVDTQDNLSEQHEHKGGCEGSMDVVLELTTFVSMAEEVGYNGDNSTESLAGNMPSGANHLYRELLIRIQ